MRPIFFARGAFGVLAGAALICSSQSMHAQAASDIVVGTFDTPDDATSWIKWYGSAPQTLEVDPAVDAQSNANSGSLKFSIDYDIAAYAGDNQFATKIEFPEILDGTKYTNLTFDVKFAPTSPTRSYGDYGYFEFGTELEDYSSGNLGNLTVPAGSNDWYHIQVPIPPAQNERIRGLFFKMWAGDTSGAGALTGTTTFWIDNVKLIASTNTAPPPPPTLSIALATPGLNLFANVPTQQYQRQSLRTATSDYSWVGAGQPVTYSVTVTNYPGTNYPNFQTHIFLVAGDSIASSDSAPDYNQPNVIFLQIGNNADGSAYAALRYKTNQPAGNSMFFTDPATGGGNLGGVGSATANGVWTLTFNNDTDATITSPSGETNTVTLPPDAAALFAGPVYAYFGVQPNAVGNIGQSAVFQRVQISGVATPINETFNETAPDPTDPNSVAQLDPAIWNVSAQDPNGVLLATQDSKFLISWTLPATGYVLQRTADLVSGPWTDIPVANTHQLGSNRVAFVGEAGQSDGFFRLVKTP
jgi:hypothetical protein